MCARAGPGVRSPELDRVVVAGRSQDYLGTQNDNYFRSQDYLYILFPKPALARIMCARKI